MLHGVDVSSWQGNIEPSILKFKGVGLDFCISKATESTDYINPNCDFVIQNCIKNKLLFGFYHYALNHNPKDEAQWFYKNTKGYNGVGIPALDYEEWTSSTKANVTFCEKFITEYHRLTSVWPLLYISASHCQDFAGSWIPENCGLWVAGYYEEQCNWPRVCPYDVSPWNYAAIWQFASDWTMKGHDGGLDGNVAFMDSNGWLKYAKGNGAASKPGNVVSKVQKTCEELAKEVIAGKWGNGWNRQNALDTAYGAGTYDHVQCIVNQMLGLDGC